MIKFSKEAKIGLIVLAGSIILILGINFLKGKGIFSSGETYYGLYNRVDGLTVSSPIFYKGFKIGTIQEVSISEDKKNIVVGMGLNVAMSFPKNTIAQIYSLDLMGSKGIRFIYGDSNKMLESGDTIQTSLLGDLADKVSKEVLPLKNKAENLVVKMDSLLTSINSLFDKQNKANVSIGIKSFGATMKNIEGISKTINTSLSPNGALGRSMSNIDSLTYILKQNGHLLDNVMANVDDVTGQLKNARIDTVAFEMSKMLTGCNTVLSNLNSGQGTIGKLLKDDKLYDNLTTLSVSLDRLLNDVRQQPSRYVRFSAISFGGGKAAKENTGNIIYKIQLIKTKRALNLRGQKAFDTYTIHEDRDGKYYLYTIAEDKNYDRVKEVLKRVDKKYPKSKIIALKDGDLIKIPKALR